MTAPGNCLENFQAKRKKNLNRALEKSRASRQSREYREVKTRIHRTEYQTERSYPERELCRSVGSHTGEIPLSTDVLKCMRELSKARKRTTQKTEEIVQGVPTGPRMVPISKYSD